MARPLKVGLDYFSVDIDFFEDEKIQFVSAKYGLKGEAITLRLLAKVYRNGYFIKWDDDIALLFANKLGNGIEVDFVNKVIDELLKREFFNKKLFDTYSILTSTGIQKRYFRVCTDSKRKNFSILPIYDLLQSKPLLTPDITQLSSIEKPHRKGKESIIKELALRLITPIKEQSFYSVLGKYTKELGEKELEAILARCIANDSKFENENKLAAYLETCKKKNGHAKVTDGLQFINEENEGWM